MYLCWCISITKLTPPTPNSKFYMSVYISWAYDVVELPKKDYFREILPKTILT